MPLAKKYNDVKPKADPFNRFMMWTWIVLSIALAAMWFVMPLVVKGQTVETRRAATMSDYLAVKGQNMQTFQAVLNTYEMTTYSANSGDSKTVETQAVGYDFWRYLYLLKAGKELLPNMRCPTDSELEALNRTSKKLLSKTPTRL